MLSTESTRVPHHESPMETSIILDFPESHASFDAQWFQRHPPPRLRGGGVHASLGTCATNASLHDKSEAGDWQSCHPGTLAVP